MYEDRIMRVATVAVLLSTMPMCGPSAPDGPVTGNTRLDFTVTGGAQAPVADTVQISSVAPGEVVIEGALSTPTPCYRVAGSLSEESGGLTLQVTATNLGGICIQVLGGFAYQARISDLAPGSISIAVVHSYPSTGWEEHTYRLRTEVPQGRDP
jgi:hypothetical protein